jgi:hypothetical protein
MLSEHELARRIHSSHQEDSYAKNQKATPTLCTVSFFVFLRLYASWLAPLPDHSEGNVDDVFRIPF